MVEPIPSIYDKLHSMMSAQMLTYGRRRSSVRIGRLYDHSGGYVMRIKGNEILSSPCLRRDKRSRESSDEGSQQMIVAPSSGEVEEMLHALSVVIRALALSESPASHALTELRGLEVRQAALRAQHIGSWASSAQSPTILFALRCLPAKTSLEGLTTLDLECNMLFDAGMSALSVEVLPHLPLLERLHLASNGITKRGLATLVQGLCGPVTGSDTSHRCALKVLGLTNNPLIGVAALEAHEVAVLLSAVIRCHTCSLQRLHANHIGLNSEGAVTLLSRVLFSDRITPTLSETVSMCSSSVRGISAGWSSGISLHEPATLYLKQNPDLIVSDVEDTLVLLYVDLCGVGGNDSLVKKCTTEVKAALKRHVVWSCTRNTP